MKVSKLDIRNFRGIKTATLFFPDHAVLIGDNNVGKSTIFEALDLVLGPERLGRKPVVDEHDFYDGEYHIEGEQPAPEITIEAIVTHLNAEQRSRFKDYIEWWDCEKNKLLTDPPPANVDQDQITHALRLVFSGLYDEEEDDFVGSTYFAKSDDEGDRQLFRRKDKQYCGFLYLRSLRTGSRALSLERGSLLDIILRIKEIRPQMWEKTIEAIADYNVASDEKLGISGILGSIQTSIEKYVPREWGQRPISRFRILHANICEKSSQPLSQQAKEIMRRHELFITTPPAALYGLDELICWPNGNPAEATYSIAKQRYCWAVWRPGHDGRPTFWWLSTKDFE